MTEEYLKEEPYFQTEFGSVKIYLEPNNRIFIEKNGCTISEFIELLRYFSENNIDCDSLRKMLKDDRCMTFISNVWDTSKILSRMSLLPDSECSSRRYDCFDLHAFAEEEQDRLDRCNPFSELFSTVDFNDEDKYRALMLRGDIEVPLEALECEFEKYYTPE